MKDYANAEWSELGAEIQALPHSWEPRREQPSWDRLFDGRAEIRTNFVAKTDKARQWTVEALSFSAIVREGFRQDPEADDTELIKFGQQAREHIAKGKQQF